MEEKKLEFKAIFDYSIRLLSLRDYSEYKLRKKLKERTKCEETIQQVIDKLLDYNYLREEEYKMARIKQLIVKGYANSYITQKLEAEMLSVDTLQIDTLRQEQNFQEEDQIAYLIQKKLRGKTIPDDYEQKMKLKNKIIRFLISKGYSFSDIQPHLNL